MSDLNSMPTPELVAALRERAKELSSEHVVLSMFLFAISNRLSAEHRKVDGLRAQIIELEHELNDARSGRMP